MSRTITVYPNPLHFCREKDTIYTTYILGKWGAAAIRYLFVINPAAGKTDARTVLLPRIRAAADRACITPEIEITKEPGHAREIATRALTYGEPVRLYACGGDGTMNEVLQAVAGREQVAVGCVPCGSGNDYVRNFGTQADFLDFDEQLRAVVRPADLIRTPQGYGIDIYAAGIDAQVANGISKWRRLPLCGGTTAYTLSILEAVCSTFRHRLRIRANAMEMEDDFMMLAICNAQMYGGGYRAAPYACIDDGLLDVVLIRPVSRIKLPRLLQDYRKGLHLASDGTVAEKFRPYMTFFRTSQIDIQVLDSRPLITTLDGECTPQYDLHAEVARRSVRILLPPKLIQNAPVLQAIGEEACPRK